MEKNSKLRSLIADVNKKEQDKHKVIKTGIASLDYILGGGIELGSKVQFVAESSTGKSTIALNICRNFCKQGLNVLYIDTENSITRELLQSTECDDYCNISDNTRYGDLVLLKESEFKTVSKMLDEFLKLGHFQLVIIDSLANLVNECYTDIDNKKKTKSEVKELTNNNTNYESRPLNLFINKYSTLAREYDTAFLYINQYRNKVDLTKGTVLKEYGNKIVRYNSDIILKIRKEKEEYIKNELGVLIQNSTGSKPTEYAKLTFTIEKSNRMLAGTVAETYIKYGYGIDETLDKISSLIRNRVITCDNGYYSIRIGTSTAKPKGMPALIEHISSHLYEFKNQYIDEDDSINEMCPNAENWSSPTGEE